MIMYQMVLVQVREEVCFRRLVIDYFIIIINLNYKHNQESFPVGNIPSEFRLALKYTDLLELCWWIIKLMLSS